MKASSGVRRRPLGRSRVSPPESGVSATGIAPAGIGDDLPSAGTGCTPIGVTGVRGGAEAIAPATALFRASVSSADEVGFVWRKKKIGRAHV